MIIVSVLSIKHAVCVGKALTQLDILLEILRSLHNIVMFRHKNTYYIDCDL